MARDNMRPFWTRKAEVEKASGRGGRAWEFMEFHGDIRKVDPRPARKKKFCVCEEACAHAEGKTRVLAGGPKVLLEKAGCRTVLLALERALIGLGD
jgi:hypothetical protein